MLFILVPAGVIMYLRPEFLGVFLVVYFVVALLLKVDSRFSIVAGLVFLLVSLIFILVKVSSLAQAAAEASYIFFIAGTISAIVEYLRGTRTEPT